MTRLTNKQNFIQLLRFIFYSIGGGVIQAGLFSLLTELTHFSYWERYLPALILCVLFNFTLNRKFTFKSAANYPLALMMVFGYYCVFTPLSTWWGTALTAIGMNTYIIMAGTMVTNFFTEFLFTRFIVLGRSINTNALGQKENAKKQQPIDLQPTESVIL
ncbi:MAG: GtrA family protein [Eubacteriales bacterium]